MAKKVYTPNKVLDVVLPVVTVLLSAYVCYSLYVEGEYFWTLVISTAVVSIAVYAIEAALRIFGKWVSSKYLDDEKHTNPLSKVLALKKFVDQGWQFVYHTVFTIWEFIVLQRHNWFKGEKLFFKLEDTPKLPEDVRFIFIVQIVSFKSLWFYQAFRHVFVNQRKKDYYELFLHHIVTISLCFVAYSRFYRHGILILFLHDSSDILVDAVKLLNLCQISGGEDYFALEITYVLTLLVWIGERLIYLPYTYMNRGILETFEAYPGMSILDVISKEKVFYSQGVCLTILYLLHWYWFALLLRIGIRALFIETEHTHEITKEGYEGASDDESEDDAEETSAEVKEKKE